MKNSHFLSVQPLAAQGPFFTKQSQNHRAANPTMRREPRLPFERTTSSPWEQSKRAGEGEDYYKTKPVPVHRGGTRPENPSASPSRHPGGGQNPCACRHRGPLQGVPAPCISGGGQPLPSARPVFTKRSQNPAAPIRPAQPPGDGPAAKAELLQKGYRHLAECGPSRGPAAAPGGPGIDRKSPDLCPMAAPVHAPSPSITAITPT